MRYLGGIAALVIVAVAAIALASSAAASHPGCRLKGAVTVKRTGQAVILKRRSNGQYYGCYLRKGAVYRLERASEWGSAVERPFTLKGRYVAYRETFDGPAEAGQGGVDMVVRNLVTGVVEHSGAYGPFYGGPLRSIQLKLNGSVAWIAQAADQEEVLEGKFLVMALDGKKNVPNKMPRPSRRLDRGDAIVPTSLRVSKNGSTLSWIDAGVRKSAAFH